MASYVSSQSCKENFGSANVGSNTVTGSNAVSNGNSIIIFAAAISQSNGNPYSWTITDNAGNTYDGEAQGNDANGMSYLVYICPSSSGSPTQFTVNGNGDTFIYMSMIVDVFSGVNASSLGVGSSTAQNPGSGTDAIASTTTTSISGGNLIWSACNVDDNTTPGIVPGTGFTAAQSATANYPPMYSEYKIGSGYSNPVATWTDATEGATGNNYYTVVSLELAAASGPSPVTGSVSETLGTLTLSATLTKTDKGTVSKTLGALLSSTTLSSTVKASGSDTLGALTLEASGAPGGINLVSTSFANWASRTNTTITAPTGIQDGDVLVVHFVLEEYTEDPVTPPTGFTLVPGPTYPVTSVNPGGAANLDNRLYYKIASGESGDYTFQHIGGASAAWMACFSGNDLVTPVTNASSAVGTGATTTVPGITTTTNGSLVIFTQQDYGYKELSNNLSGPTGFTPLNTWAEDNNLYASTYTQPTLGATGSLSITNNNGATSFGWAGFQFAINPPPSFAGKLSEPLGALTVDATGVFAVELVESATLGSLGVVSTGKVTTFQGTGVAETLGILTSVSTVAVTGHATASDTLGTLTVSATGIFKQTAHATVSVTLGTLTVSGGMASDDPGNLNRTLGALTLMATATRPAHAALSVTLGVATGSAVLSPIDKLTGSDTLAALTMVGRARNLATDHFTLTATLSAVTATFITAKTKFDTVNARTHLTVTGYQPGTPPIQNLRVS